MVVLTFFWMNQPRTYGDETFFVKWLTVIKRTILDIDEKPPYKDYLFIDASESKAILPLTSDTSRSAIITDRKKLTEVFNFLHQNQNDFRYIVCDILFDQPSILDSGLENSIQKLGDKFLGVNELQEDSILNPIIKVPHASSSLFVHQGTIVKYPIFLKDNLKTLPSEMYEKLEGVKLENRSPVVWIEKKGLSVGSPILEMAIREIDFKKESEQDSAYVKIGLGEIVSLIRLLKNNPIASQKIFDQYFRNRIIMIGDFVSDQHSTVYGDLSGTLSILNAYLTLKSGKNIIGIGLLLFLLFGFGIISYTLFIDKTIRIRGFALKIFEHKHGFLRFFYYYGIALTIMMVIAYYVFGIHIGILFLLVYLKAIDWIYNKRYIEWWEDVKVRYKKFVKFFNPKKQIAP